MKTREMVPIVWVEQVGPVAKGPVPWSKTPGYAAPIRYILSDGTTEDASVMASRKKDVVAKLAAMPAPPKEPTWANYHDGRYVGTRTSYWIGAGPDTTSDTAEWKAAVDDFASSLVALAAS